MSDSLQHQLPLSRWDPAWASEAVGATRLAARYGDEILGAAAGSARRSDGPDFIAGPKRRDFSGPPWCQRSSTDRHGWGDPVRWRGWRPWAIAEVNRRYPYPTGRVTYMECRWADHCVRLGRRPDQEARCGTAYLIFDATTGTLLGLGSP